VSELRPDRLWPVLLVLSLLLAGAVYMEVSVEGRGETLRRVQIVAAEADTISDGDGEDDGEEGAQALSLGAAVSDEHARARTLARRRQLDEAVALYEAILKAQPGAARVRGELGYWLREAGQSERGLAELEKAWGTAQDDPWVGLSLGRARMRGGDMAGAERALRETLLLRPGYGPARISLGAVLRRQGKLEDSVAVLREAAAYGSNEERARGGVALGRSLLKLGDLPGAREAFEQAIHRAPALVELRVSAARALVAAEGPELRRQGVSLLEDASLLAPESASIRGALGRAYEKIGKKREAKGAYAKALELDPAYAYVRRRMIRLALDQGELPVARLHADYLLESGPDAPEHHFLAGLVAAEGDRYDDARAHLREALDRASGDYPEAWYNLGLSERRAGRPAEAIAAYKEAVALRPDYARAYNNMALAQQEAEDPKGAEASLRRAIELDPGYSGARFNLASLLSKSERYEEAVETYRELLRAEPANSKAALNLGVTLGRAGRAEEAVKVYRALLERRPRYTAARHNLGLAQEDAGDLAGALVTFELVFEMDPERTRALRKVASLQAALGRDALAIGSYREYLEREPNSERARLELAALLRRQGDRAGCAQEAARVLRSDPEDATALNLAQACGPEKK